ncbi:MAG: LysM peptidoglycan-binding domain-containing protein [Treponema sp.]|nr:LysM peptidoglycan-binding domain-containing protein [Treponema sp.]
MLAKKDEEEETDSDQTIVSDEDSFAYESIPDDDSFANESIPDDDITIADDSSELVEEHYDLPDFTEDEISSNYNMDDDDFYSTYDNLDTSDSEAAPGNGISFTGLYDKETEMGDSSIHEEEDEVKKKTKVPVIICIVCAIICLIATALILFIIPSKYNLLSKKQADENKIEVVENTPAPIVEEVIPEPEPEPEPVPPAKEDEVIVIEEAEEVVPEAPAPVVEEKPADVKYKIKWGDTLWDIADTYYKNPWRYKKIARYNGIKNPDYIISGTVILIPVE